MNYRRHQAIWLRIIAVTNLIFLPVTFLPMRCVAYWHTWLGLGGVMPQDALLTYLARWSCFDYGMIGFVLWIIATDVVKYRPLVILTGVVFVIASPAAVFIDTTAGMPVF